MAALGVAGSCGQATGPRRKIERIGLELYTVRELMKADLPGTLARVAEIGYKEVEFAGYFGKSPTEIRDALARTGLTSPSAHIGLDEMRKEGPRYSMMRDRLGINGYWFRGWRRRIAAHSTRGSALPPSSMLPDV